MSNKTISINPNLFSLGGSKTKKNREKKQKPSIVPLISPNVLKNKLLKRIKEHKHRETENLGGSKKIHETINDDGKEEFTPNTSTNNTNSNNDSDIDNFTDEFSNSLNYLQTLSKQKRVNDEKINFENKKRQKQLERNTTIKNYQALHNSPVVNIELPEELSQPLIRVNTEHFTPGTETMVLNPYKNDHVPYGVLKGGQKPTYRDWNKTQRNNVVTNPHAALTIQGSNNTTIQSERENRLHNLREKLKLKQLEETIQKNEDIMMTQNLIQKPSYLQNTDIGVDAMNSSAIESHIPSSSQIQPSQIQPSQIQPSQIQPSQIQPSHEENIIAIKKINKKTIKRKYTLGKSKIKKTVGILVKNRGTRKLILHAQKDLKRKQINDIKTYLREHNLIKVGSNAPNDVLRKMYESAMLAGEITNSNAETLLHNFSKSDKEL